jgi:hypothetical protein
MRLELSSDIREQIGDVSRLHQKELLSLGKHNWQKEESKKKRLAAIKNLHRERREAGLGAFLGIENITENARKAGLKAAEKRAGFLDTSADHHGSKYVKETTWWYNSSTKKRKRSKVSPGPEWTEGMGKLNHKGHKR